MPQGNEAPPAHWLSTYLEQAVKVAAEYYSAPDIRTLDVIEIGVLYEYLRGSLKAASKKQAARR